MNNLQRVTAHVWSVSETFFLKSGRFKGGPGKIIIFRSLPKGLGYKEYKLNLPLQYENANQWLRDCKPGNIIEGLNVNERGTIAWWQPYLKVHIKDKNKE